MAFSTPVAAQAAGKDHRSAMTIAGYDTFATYDGTEGSGTKELAGLRLIDDHTFSVTIAADYIPYSGRRQRLLLHRGLLQEGRRW